MAREVRVNDVMGVLPSITLLQNGVVPDIDFFITALGYEDRTLGTLRRLASQGVRISQAIILEQGTGLPENTRHEAEALRLFEDMGAVVARQDRIADIFESLPALRQRGDGFPVFEVVLDISVMSGSLILACVERLARALDPSRVSLSVLYTEAAIYLPSHQDFTDHRDQYLQKHSFGLQSDILEVKSVENMGGYSDPHLRDLVVSIPGFDRDRARAAISYVNPALLLNAEGNVTWWLSIPRLEADRWRFTTMREILDISSSERVEEVSSFDYASIFKRLEQLYEVEWQHSNVTVAFHGSKLQALAVGIFAALRPSCRVIVATPTLYNVDNYTSGVGPSWRVHFADWQQVLTTLRTIGTVYLGD